MKRWLQRWGAGCCLVVIIVMIFVLNLTNGSVQASYAQQRSDLTFEQVIEDIHSLYAVIDARRGSDVKLVASSYAVMETHESLRPRDIVLRIVQSSDQRNLDIQEGEASALGVVALQDDISLSISVQTQSSTEALVVARVEAMQIEQIESETVLLDRWSELDEYWAVELGKRPEWRINLQADLAAEHQPNDLWEALDMANTSMIDHAGSYDDKGSTSRVFHVPWIHQSVMMQGEEVQLQVALHRSSEDQTYRITLGTPLITIEY